MKTVEKNKEILSNNIEEILNGSLSTGKYTGYNDHLGNKINTGNIVQFYFDEHKGVSFKKQEGMTRMVDLVFEGKDRLFYLICPNNGKGAFINRYNDYCQVIGNLPEDKEQMIALASLA